MTDIDDRSSSTDAPPRPSSGFECFPMFNRKAALGRPDLFVSAKTRTAIPARCGLLREALVQSSLDPAVRSIGFVATAVVASEPVDLGAVVLHRDDGRFLLDVAPARRIRDLEQEGLAPIAMAHMGLVPLIVTEEQIRREPRKPRYANARLVWSHNGSFVPIGLRMRIMQVLLDEGPMELGRLLSGFRSDRDPTAAVLALACADLLELDLLSRPLGPATLVGSRT